MTNWISATGASSTTTMAPDNLVNKEVSREPAYVVGNGGLEVNGAGPVSSG